MAQDSSGLKLFDDMDDAKFQEMLLQTFLEEALFLLDELEAGLLNLEQSTEKHDTLGRIFRAAHSIKGSAGAVGLKEIAEFAHIEEDCLAVLRTSPELISAPVISALLKGVDALKWRTLAIKDNSAVAGTPWAIDDIKKEIKYLTSLMHQRPVEPNVGDVIVGMGFAAFSDVATAATQQEEMRSRKIGEVLVDNGVITQKELNSALDVQKMPGLVKKPTGTSIKVDSERIEGILNLAGELVGLKILLMQNPQIKSLNDSNVDSIISLLDKTVRELYDKSLSVRMTSLKPLFLKLQRTVRDLSEKLDKPIDFQTQGDDTELDRAIIEQLSDPMMHLIRNALDHGVENRERREAKGKPAVGKLTLKAFSRSGSVIIEIVDDGGGIDRKRVFAKGVENGLLRSDTAEASLSDQDVYGLLFKSGFSTAAAVTDVSGRGVGLDVVKSNIESLKGKVEVESELHKGTTFRLVLPLTSAITDGMVVESGGERYVIPIQFISEFARFTPDMIFPLGSQGFALLFRGNTMPIIKMSNIVSRYSKEPITETVALIAMIEGQRVALAVEAVLGQSQVVLKPVQSEFTKMPVSIAGAAILDDGKVGLVLDVISLIDQAQQVKAAA